MPRAHRPALSSALPIVPALLGLLVAACAPAAARPGAADLDAPTARSVTPRQPLALATASPAVPAVPAASATAPAPSVAPLVAQPVPTPAGSLTVSADLVAPGACVDLSWRVSGAAKVRLGGQFVAAAGSQSVCPELDTTYYLWYESPDGRPGERTVSVRVAAATDPAGPVALADAPEDAERPQPTEVPTLEPTPCETECVVIAPTERPRPTRRPTSEPTRPPDPTEEPAPPTTGPDPTDQPEPTTAPEPTEPPPTAEPEPTAGAAGRR